jgi:lipooligosaccharide transport system ATP-binding protein
MQPVIEARGLVKRYGAHRAVDGIDFTVRQRQCFGFVGPNGAGKTTTLHMILGRSPMNGGTLTVFGLTMPRHAEQIKARIGLMPQANNLDPELTVEENLRIYGGYFDIPSATLTRRIEQLLDFVELADRAGDRPHTLSGGMKRRLVFARALINDPEMIVLDEPTTGLDPQARHMLWSRLRELKSRGRTLLLTTHYLEEAERLCDDLVIMDHGRILDQGSPPTLIERHVEPRVLEIYGDAQLVHGRLNGAGGFRAESVGDTVYCYTDDDQPLLAALNTAPALTYSRRDSNLEDVFLKLTGRALRD